MLNAQEISVSSSCDGATLKYGRRSTVKTYGIVLLPVRGISRDKRIHTLQRQHARHPTIVHS